MIVGAALERIDPAQRSWEQMMREEMFSLASEPEGFGFGPPTGTKQAEGHSKNLFGQLKPVGQGLNLGIIAATNQADGASKGALQKAADQILALHASRLGKTTLSQPNE